MIKNLPSYYHADVFNQTIPVEKAYKTFFPGTWQGSIWEEIDLTESQVKL